MRIFDPVRIAYPIGLGIIIGVGVAVVGLQSTLPFEWLLGIVPVLLGIYIGLKRPLTRRRLIRAGIPEQAREWLLGYVPFYRALDVTGRYRFEVDFLIYLNEWRFEAVGGAEDADDLRWAVAAGAALALYGRPDWELPRQTVLFYPAPFDENYYEGEAEDYDGMAHPQGPLLFTTGALRRTYAVHGDGNQIVIHELAHLFDFSGTRADGIPSLMERASIEAWQNLMRKEMQEVRSGRSLLRPYAATNEAEFFAVASENFFDRPWALNKRHPEIYEALKNAYAVDTLSFLASPAK